MLAFLPEQPMPIYSLGSRRPQYAGASFVADNATLIGSVELGEGASVWYGVVIRADMDRIVIGARCNIQDNAVLHADEGVPLIIGRDVTVGHQATVHGCTIGDGALIGMGAIILNKAVIGAGSIVAAGAIVPEGKHYPEHSLIMGAPATVKRTLSDDEVAGLIHSAEHYHELAERYQGELAANWLGDS
jgi:carbonic anhydrase/acetyltransferase-like protein (isoleucine patch superfamily)